ncbi:hypothetical protein ACDH70_02050 [Xanthomonas axonopodis pv. poinsettiicola]|uniref:hypothetical protein n=1 Tax=Xanthomonas TaxID=338 RepID=UPI001E5B6F1B|nr:hypothetical protein [Xanthomonas codiaei]MCC8539699.1 hypothetical protein [Xanthomonas codiaei]
MLTALPLRYAYGITACGKRSCNTDSRAMPDPDAAIAMQIAPVAHRERSGVFTALSRAMPDPGAAIAMRIAPVAHRERSGVFAALSHPVSTHTQPSRLGT